MCLFVEIRNLWLSQVVVAHTINHGVEAGGSLSVRQPGLQSEFQDIHGYTEKNPCLGGRVQHQEVGVSMTYGISLCRHIC